MVVTPRHFGINADDLPRARRFYERVFGWKIEPTQWDGYLQIAIAGVPTAGLQGRRELVKGVRANSFELSFAVADIAATLDDIANAGGTVLMRPSPIPNGPTVGYFQDTEGNTIGVGQYPAPRAPAAPPTLRYFAMNADNVQRAKAFYERVFGWTYKPWGPPDYYQVQTDGAIGALQERRPLVKGVRINAPEPTFGVDDIRATLAAAQAAGGAVLRPIGRIEGGPEVAYVQDTEGNMFGLGQYPDAPR